MYGLMGSKVAVECPVPMYILRHKVDFSSTSSLHLLLSPCRARLAIS
jgi:hypothetical protein